MPPPRPRPAGNFCTTALQCLGESRRPRGRTVMNGDLLGFLRCLFFLRYLGAELPTMASAQSGWPCWHRDRGSGTVSTFFCLCAFRSDF